MHNAAIAALGLNWRYLAFEVSPNDLRAAIEGAKAMRFVGLNLTVPHKLLAMEMMDVLDESARTWGAVNTVRFEAKYRDGDWKALSHFSGDVPERIRAHGFNTDADAIARSLGEDLQIEIAGDRILLLGAGGAGRVAALKFAQAGARELFLVNRTRSKAEEIAAEITQLYPKCNVNVGYPAGPVDLVVNATSLGLKREDALPFDPRAFPLSGTRAALDMIYRPAETPFLKAAKAAGCRTANGLGMLLYQGAKALELWSGKNPPIGIMREALVKNIYGSAI